MSSHRALQANPDWPAAAQILIDGCAHAAHPQARVDLLERLCMALGDALYPAFLNVLTLVGERGSPAAQSAVSEGLVDALRSGRLPAGRRAAWGAALRPDAVQTRAPMVSLGPIEFVCAAQAPSEHTTTGTAPDTAHFAKTLTALLRLVGHNDRARQLYIARLGALVQDPLDGGLSRNTRQVLRALADAWSHTASSPAQVVDAVMQALPRPDSLSQFGRAAWR